jgi:uncharacterized membrane protein YphA (DoxX/SURF4 family)
MASNGRNSQGKRDLGGIGMWVGQGLLAALFLFAGGMKLMAPAEMFAQGPVVLPVLFMRFIGVCEVLGAFGLILPWALRIHRELTPLAAAGLMIIMLGATVVVAIGGQIAGVFTHLLIAVLLITISLGRWRRLQTV